MISGTTARSSSWPRRLGMPVDVQDVEQAAAGVADGRDDALQAAPAVVLDDDAGVGREVGAQVGVDATRIGDGGRHAVIDETPSERAAFDQELDVEGPRQNAMQGPDDQLVLTDGQRTHNRTLYESRAAVAPRATLRAHATSGHVLAARVCCRGARD